MEEQLIEMLMSVWLCLPCLKVEVIQNLTLRAGLNQNPSPTVRYSQPLHHNLNITQFNTGQHRLPAQQKSKPRIPKNAIPAQLFTTIGGGAALQKLLFAEIEGVALCILIIDVGVVVTITTQLPSQVLTICHLCVM